MHLSSRSRLLALALFVGAIVLLPLARAEATPGPLPAGAVTLTAVGGSSISSGGAAVPVRTPAVLPECSDGIDNESGVDENGATYKDAKIDYPADPQCTSATDDSEIIGSYSGFGFPAGLPADPQPVVAWAFPATVTGTTLTVPQAGFTSPVSYARNGGCTIVCANYFSKQTLLATANGTGTVGSDGAITIDLPVKAQVLLVRGPGANGLAPASQTCETPSFTLHLTTGTSGSLSGARYDAATGRATLVDGTYAVPALAQTVANGTNLCTNANTSGGLPSASGSNQLSLIVSTGTVAGTTTTTSGQATTTTTSGQVTTTTTSGPTTTTSTIQPGGNAPVANAGADLLKVEGDVIKLVGTATDADTPANQLTYAWTQLTGPAVTLTGAATATATFTGPDGPAVLTFSLTVSDGSASSAPDVVKVSVLNKKPVVNAGVDHNVASGAAGVTLAGTATDVPGDPLRLLWTQTSGPAVTLTGATTATPSFTAPAGPVDLTFTFSATDDSNLAGTDTVLIRVSSPASVLPTPNAGPDQFVYEGTVAKLKGTATDPDTPAASLTYRWVQTSGPVVSLSSTTLAQPTFTAPDGPATLTFDLFVKDTVGESVADAVKVVVLNKAPLVSAGPAQTVASGATVTLAGTATDVPGDPVTLKWTQTAGPAVVLTGATSAAPTFKAPTGPATIDLTLTATDDSLAKGTATVRITVTSPTGTISGKLTYVTFVALDGATVTAYNASTGAPVATAITAADGTYALSLPAGSYKLGFSKLLYATEYWKDQTSLGAAQVITLPAGGAVTANADLFFGI